MNKILLTLSLTVLIVGSMTARAEEVAAITLTADKIQFIFDIKEFTVKPGQKVKLTLINPADSVTRQPHNVLIVKPGKKDVVGMAANNGMADPAFLTTKQAVPDSEDILHHSKLIQAGEQDTIEFTAPTEVGDYPYICTYPGHWAIMNGIMKVAE
jgi:azurin